MFGRSPALTAASRIALALTCTVVAGCSFLGNDDATGPVTTVASEAAALSTTTSTAPPASGSTIVARPQDGADGVGDEFFPLLGNGGYDVINYDLELNLTGAELRATATIELVADVPLSTFHLDLVGLTVDRIFVDSVEATFDRNGRELEITPATPIAGSSAATVVVDYRGEPDPIDDPSGPIELGWHTESWGTYVASEPLGAATWFPANDHPTDKATFRIAVTVPEGITAAGPGLLTSQVTTGGATTFVWEMNDPMATYLASVVTGDFAILTTDGPGGVVIRNVLPTDRASQLVPALASTAEMLEQMSEWFGPYPFDSYGVVAVPDDFTFALENQTLSLFDTDFLTLRRRTVENVLAHELAHHWFGNHVSPGDWSDIWLNEGFASWVDHYWTELDGGTTFDEREIVARSLELPPPTSVRPATMFSQTVYLRGALTLEALRRTVGDDVFFPILQTWVADFGGSAATTDDFLTLVDRRAGAAATAVVTSWLFEPEMPRLPAAAS